MIQDQISAPHTPAFQIKPQPTAPASSNTIHTQVSLVSHSQDQNTITRNQAGLKIVVSDSIPKLVADYRTLNVRPRINEQAKKHFSHNMF